MTQTYLTVYYNFNKNKKTNKKIKSNNSKLLTKSNKTIKSQRK